MKNFGKSTRNFSNEVLIILFLVVFSLGVQLYFLNPPILSDQMEYFFTAVKFPRLPAWPNISSMRIGLLLPVSVLYRVFGYSETAYYTFPFVAVTALAISIYWIGKVLFSVRVGFFSALTALLVPNLIQEYGHLLPDIPATACSTAAFAVLLDGFQRLEKGDATIPKRVQRQFLLAGFLFGWSYLIKEYLAVLFFLIPVLFMMFKIPWRYLYPLVGGMIAMYMVEAITGIVYYQNPFIRFIAAAPRETVGEIHKDIGKIISFLFILLSRDGGAGFLLIMSGGFFHTILRGLKGEKRYAFMLGWILLIYLLFTAAGLLPVLYKWEDIVLLRLHKFRYWIPILPPLVIGGIAMLDSVISRIARKWRPDEKYRIAMIMLVVVFVAGAIGFHEIKDDPNFIRNSQDHYLELRRYLRSDDCDCGELIWVDRDNRRAFERILPMYIRNPFGRLIWGGKFKYINTDGLYLKAEEISIGCVIVDRFFMTSDSGGIPDYLWDPPENWSLVFESTNQEIALYNVQL